MESLVMLKSHAANFLALYVPKVAGALITLVIGLWIIKKITNFIAARMKKSKVDETLIPFFRNMINLSLKVILVISVAGILGIQTTSFIAVLGAAGLAIGMALQGSLSNFAGGVLILIFRPFKVGDYVKAQGHEGNVKEILLFVTKFVSLDNKVIYIPNGPLANGPIENLSEEPTRRVDMTFGISYSDDIDMARKVIEETLNAIPEILKSPKADIILTELADSSVNFSVRPWCKSEDYWTVYGEVHELIKKAFDDKKVTIPFPQREVHLLK